ncbi:hypothetical protein [Nocardiopsis tropica]|uniref:Uncharacterized protein n=1 Tax=Nocardiopsis tropica TaxID=109330 RepID=A0ABU7KN19_9ACTN|nr:hypothetical protein [Nocardiopsis umidischolae]MEE2050646.1 hypothetical protein [Nocardiopsis umidischolae]
MRCTSYPRVSPLPGRFRAAQRRAARLGMILSRQPGVLATRYLLSPGGIHPGLSEVERYLTDAESASRRAPEQVER